MKISRSILNEAIQNIAFDYALSEMHNIIHESEGSECKIRLRPGETYEVKFPVRVIVTEEGPYFGGEIGGHRNRGKSTATIRPGTKLLCKATSGPFGIFDVPGLDEYVRIHTNKFCDITRNAGLLRKKPDLPSKRAEQGTSKLSPDDKDAKIAQLMDMIHSLGIDPSELSINIPPPKKEQAAVKQPDIDDQGDEDEEKELLALMQQDKNGGAKSSASSYIDSLFDEIG